VRAKQRAGTGRRPRPHIADLFPDGFEEAELGATPKGWQVLTFEHLVEAQQGKYIPRKEMKELPDGELIGSSSNRVG